MIYKNPPMIPLNKFLKRNIFSHNLLIAMALCANLRSDCVSAEENNVPVKKEEANSAKKTTTGTNTPTQKNDKKLIKSKDYYIKGDDQLIYEQQSKEKRNDAIIKLQKILESGNIQGEQRADILLRLAELYWEKAKNMYLSEMSAYLEVYGKWADSKDSNKNNEPKEDHTESKKFNQMATDLYRAILKEFPNYNRIDEVYFYLGFNLMDLGNKDQALEQYLLLAKNYPRSDFVPDAYLAIGEFYFDNNNAFKALTNYKKAASYTNSKVVVFALYKLAWCYYNVGEYTQAIDSMKEVVKKSSGNSLETGNLSLKEEALNDLVLFYSELKDSTAASEYFSTFGEKKYYKSMLRRLANIYIEQGKVAEAVETFKKLIAEEPLAKDAPSLQNEIVKIYIKEHQKDKALESLDILTKNYGPNSPWADSNKNNTEATNEAFSLIEKNIRDIAVTYHKEARRVPSPSTIDTAMKYYRQYLTVFPKGVFSYEIQYAYAEILYETKNYTEALNMYEQVIAIDNKGKYFQISVTSALLTIDKLLSIEKKTSSQIEKQPPATTDTPTVKKESGIDAKERGMDLIPLTNLEERKIKIADVFIKEMSSHKDGPDVLFESAKILYDKNHFDESNKKFLYLIELYPKNDLAEVAANLILDSYNMQKKWDQVANYSDQFRKNESFKQEFRKELDEIFEKSTYKTIEHLESSGKTTEAAVSYETFYKNFPKSTFGDKALFNAAFYAYKDGKVKESIELRTSLAKNFPSSSLSGKNFEALGKAYELIADYKSAAICYEKLAEWDKTKTYNGTADSLFNAALFRESLNDWKIAISNFELYLKSFAGKDDAYEALFRIAMIYESNKKYEEAAIAFKKLFTDPILSQKNIDVSFEARIRYGKMLIKTNQKELAFLHFQQSIELFEKLPNNIQSKAQLALVFVSEMKFYLVEPSFSKYIALKITLPKKGSKENSLDIKLKQTDVVVKQYMNVLQLKVGEWGIASLYQIGAIYKNLAEELLHSPIPPELTADQSKLYKAALQDKAFPIKDKAAEAMEQALAKSYELGIYNDYTSKAALELSVLKPKEYPVLAEKIGTAEYLSDTFITMDFIRE